MAEVEIRDASVEDDGDAAMQAMLGFSAFGAQNPKKRKFSGTVVGAPSASAAQDGAPSAGLPPPPPGLPSRPPPTTTTTMAGSPEEQGFGHGHGHQHPYRPHQQRNQHARQHGAGRTDPWWDGYYDPTSNENPWVHEERKLGLDAKGTWLAKAHRHPKD